LRPFFPLTLSGPINCFLVGDFTIFCIFNHIQNDDPRRRVSTQPVVWTETSEEVHRCPPEFLMSWEVAEQTEQSARETQWSVGFLPENGWEFCGATWILDHLTKVLVVSVHQSV
jgi:hypothetical protein